MKKGVLGSEKEALEFLNNFAPLPPYELDFENRNIILETSLVLEKTITALISELLGIKNPEDSITLGNKSSSLSFNQKVDLLIDLGALGKEDKKKFQAFMEIRNTFMHLFEANSFVTCFNHLKKKNVLLFKLYPQANDKNEEERLKAASVQLANDVLSLTFGIMNKIVSRNQNERLMSS